MVSKAEICKWPVVGWLAAQLGTVFVQREKRSDAKRIIHELSDRLMVGVFSEGTRRRTAHRSCRSTRTWAAVSAAVQPICLMYEDARGTLSTAHAFIGDMTLNDSLDALLLYVCNTLAPGADRRLLGSEAQASVQAALDRMRGAPVVEPVTSSSHNSPA